MSIYEADRQRLFVDGHLDASFDAVRQRLGEEIERYDQNRLLNTSPDDLANYFVSKCEVQAIELKKDSIYVTEAESKIDVSRDPDRAWTCPTQPFYLNGTNVTFHVPFEGDADLFRMQPSSFTFNPPLGTIADNELLITFSILDEPDSEKIRANFDNQFRQVEQYVRCVASDIAVFNNSLKGIVRQAIDARRSRLLASKSLVASLGFPMKQRDGAPQTYVAPSVRRKAVPTPPMAPTAAYVPEPALGMGEYEHILSIMQNMVLVMERTPSAFVHMLEPDIRTHFLVQLNGQYEGQGTAETFNYEGKTDILIREKGKNIFIAECKFWDGPKSLTDAIDQLLGYACWRDTKVAVLVFNRRLVFGDVLAQIPDILKQHPNYKRDFVKRDETQFRCIFKHRDDPNRELVLTVAAFDVPHKEDDTPTNGAKKLPKAKKKSSDK